MTRIAFLVVGVLASQSALACKCGRLPLAELYAQAPIAFVGAADNTFRPGKTGETAKLLVSRALKGDVHVGSSFEIDPLFESDCAAYIMPAVQLLVFAYPSEHGPAIVSACSVRLAGAVATGEGGSCHLPKRS